jgi:hypothetical protein
MNMYEEIDKTNRKAVYSASTSALATETRKTTEKLGTSVRKGYSQLVPAYMFPPVSTFSVIVLTTLEQ